MGQSVRFKAFQERSQRSRPRVTFKCGLLHTKCYRESFGKNKNKKVYTVQENRPVEFYVALK